MDQGQYKDEADDETLSLSDLQMEETTTATTGSEEVISQTFYEDFFGFSVNEICSSPSKNSPVKLPVSDHHDDDKVSKPTVKVVETNPFFRSNSGSFKYMRLKMASTMETWRSKSLSVVASSKSKSRWQVFMFGSGKFPTKMDLIDIKSRQLRSGSTTNVSSPHGNQDSCDGSGGRKASGGKKVWWRLVEFLGCGGGYEKDTKIVV